MINVARKPLAKALAALARVIPSRSSNPVLTSLLVCVHETHLDLIGTNLEIAARLSVDAEIALGAHGQRFTVPAHLFEQLIREARGEHLELNLVRGELHIQAGGARVNLRTGDTNDYPELTVEFEHHGTPAALYVDALERAHASSRYAVAVKAFQAVFRGLLLELTEEHTRFVGSDGFRMALGTIPQGHDRSRDVLIPARNADELLRLVKGHEQVDVSLGESNLVATAPRLAVRVHLMDGAYPDYDRVVPKDTDTTVTIDAAALRESLARVSILADKNANNRVEIAIGQGRVTLVTEGDYGRAEDTLEATVVGPALQLGLNGAYLRDALGPVRQNAVLGLTNATAPITVRDTGDDGLLAVVVPLRV